MSQQFLGSVFIAANSYRLAAREGLDFEVLLRADEAIDDFVNTFYSLRFNVDGCWDSTAELLEVRLQQFFEAFNSGKRASGKFAVFVFVGHGGDSDVLYAENGKTISTEKIVKYFTAELPKRVFKMFFIDACRGDGVKSGVRPYCPVEENCLFARSTLPYQKAWPQGTYGELCAPKLKLIIVSLYMCMCNDNLTYKLYFVSTDSAANDSNYPNPTSSHIPTCSETTANASHSYTIIIYPDCICTPDLDE